MSVVVEMARKRGIPLLVDPKGADFTKYRGATLVKPNLVEAYLAAKEPRESSLDCVASRLLEISQADLLLVTRSEAGMSLFEREGKRSDFSVRSREVLDVTGAGDTVLAMIAAAFANGLHWHAAAHLANIAAGIAIEKVGCAQVTISELAQRLLEFDREAKIFDEDHTEALQQALKGQRYALLLLSSGQEISPSLFHAIRQLSSVIERKLLVALPHPQKDGELVQFLSSLQEVDYIVFQSHALKRLIQMVPFDEIRSLEVKVHSPCGE
jgi:D-beta-D-heptose 7-phosphate kinase/D-beta-D-heptose 1-phosphate adenosyltransferase